MNTKSNTQRLNPNVLDTDKFQCHKGFFVIDDICIMTKNQIVTIMNNYQLVEFLDAGGIRLREVVFWYSVITGTYLKIIVYDVNNKVLVQKLHDLTKPKYDNDWFLIEEGIFDDDLLEFDF